MGAAPLQPLSGRLPANRSALLNTRFSRSLSVPVTPENRRHLRLLRELELAAWVAARGPQDPPPASAAKSLRGCVNQLRDERRKETVLYALLAALAFGSTGYGLFQSGELVQQWGVVTRFVQQLLAA